jgi:oxidase EvaA
VINQPEIGILGIAVREFDGVLHFLMQAKSEPGNVNGVQISPTVQATRSNYTRVHGGRTVPYLDLFRDAPPDRIVSDVLQSEQGAWFHQKRNRNMVVEAAGDVPLDEDFRWLTLGQLHRLLHVDNLVNMDTRTVLSCLPAGPERTAGLVAAGERTGLAEAVELSSEPAVGGLHAPVEVLSWITDQQARRQVRAALCPLDAVQRWHRDEWEIRHELGVFFSVVGVDIETEGREIASWSQPLVRPVGEGLVAMLVTRVDGVLHALMHARVEAGYLDVVELAPTVQCVPRTYDVLSPQARPPFLDLVQRRRPEQVLFSAEMSEEGGRFQHARNRYEIIEVDPALCREDRPDFRWLTLAQLTDLLRHSHYVNVQARSLIACLRGLR